MSDPGNRLALFVWDKDLNCREGAEEEKLLSFHPTNSPVDKKCGMVGLLEALITFTALFSPDAPCESARADRHRQILFQCEPGIWMALIVGSDLAPFMEIRDEALRNLLRETYQLFHLLNGSIRGTLAKGPPADCRAMLAPIMGELWTRISSGKRGEFGLLMNALSGREGLPYLPLSRQLLLNCQYVANVLETAYDGSTVAHVLVLHDANIVWSSLNMPDTLALYRLAARCLVPSAMKEPSTTRRKILSRLSSSDSIADSSSPDSPPFRAGDWKVGSDSFLCPSEALASNGSAGGATAAPLTLHLSGEQCYSLLAYQCDSMTVVMAVRGAATAKDASVRLQLAGLIDSRLRQLDASLTELYSNPNRCHVPGYRYLFIDRETGAQRCSPEVKVGTLSRESMGALSAVRAEIEERSALTRGRHATAAAQASSAGDSGPSSSLGNTSTSSADPSSSSGGASTSSGGAASSGSTPSSSSPGGKGDAPQWLVDKYQPPDGPEWEVCVRPQHDAWIIVRKSRERYLYVILEKAGDSLLEASDAVQRLSESHFNGIFYSD